MDSNYFEGILQLRNPTDKIVDFVFDRVEKSGIAKIAKTEKHKNGIDFYITSNKFLKEFASELNSKFSGMLKITYTLHTRKEGVDIYRMTVLFRVSPFKEMDIIEFKGDKYKVAKMGERVELKDMNNGKRKLVKYEEVESAFRPA